MWKQRVKQISDARKSYCRVIKKAHALDWPGQALPPLPHSRCAGILPFTVKCSRRFTHFLGRNLVARNNSKLLSFNALILTGMHAASGRFMAIADA